ncbi:tigger transposable element-derived protein 4-like [Littorina saxatilis]|uniref:tigger transposable element-derived protein 4-like n=1 Tax=Littorina saxatilis TaxID=31220 RepID=UPI0038B6ABF5
MDMNRLPTEYKHQKRAWMDSALFTSWVNKLDQKMAIRGRKIALIMDNCPAHPTVPALKATKVIFLPPNTTSVTQPMDQGIIQNLKVHYRHLYVKRGLLPAVEKKEAVIWTLLDCMSALKDAWTKVKPSTVANCFKHCGFFKDQATIICEDDPEDDLPLAQLVANLQASNMPADDEALRLFLEVDDDISTSAPLTADGIVQDIQSSLKTDPVDTDSEEEEEETTTPPTYAKAMESLATLRHVLVAMPKAMESLATLRHVLVAMPKAMESLATLRHVLVAMPKAMESLATLRHVLVAMPKAMESLATLRHVLVAMPKAMESLATLRHVLVAMPKAMESLATLRHVLVAMPKAMESLATLRHVLVAMPKSIQ